MTSSALAPMKGKGGEIMDDENLKKIANVLLGLSYKNWCKLKRGIDGVFELKEREFKHALKLSSLDEITRFIRSQFE